MRIASLLPSATEIVAALGLADSLVGRSHECDYPAGVESLPVLTAPKLDSSRASGQIDRDVRAILADGLSVYDVDAELLRRLKPDVIVTQSQCELCAVSERDVEQAVADWVGSRPAVLSLSPMRLDDIFSDIEAAAELLDAKPRGAELVARLKRDMGRTAERTADLERKRVFFMEWIEPLMGAGNWMPAIWRAAGGEIVLGADGEHSPECGWDQLVEAQPDVVVAGPCGFDIARTRRELESGLQRRPQWRELRAVARGDVFIVDGNQYYNRPGPRVAEAARIAAEILHPDRFQPTFQGAGWQRYEG